MKHQTAAESALLKAMNWSLPELQRELLLVGIDPDEEAENLRSMIRSMIDKAVLQSALAQLILTSR